jgi:hypothetical protein
MRGAGPAASALSTIGELSMIWTLAGLSGVTATVLLTRCGVALGRRWRSPPPDIVVLCMAAEAGRRVRVQLRIPQAADRPGWTLRGIEWLAPDDVRLALSPRGRAGGAAIAAGLRLDDRTGARFVGDITIWAVYPSDRRPPHTVSLRLTLDHEGRRRRQVVSTVFPGFDWSPAARPPQRRAARAAALPCRAERRESGLAAEPRSFAEGRAAPVTVGFA